MQPNPLPPKLPKQNSNPSKQKQKSLIPIASLNLPKSFHSETSREQRKQIFNPIYQLKIKQHPELKQKLSQILTEQDSSLQTLFVEFKILMDYFKEHQTMTPIIDIYYYVFRDRMLEKRDKEGKDIDVFWGNWKAVPMSHLENYFKTFSLNEIVEKTNVIEFYNIVRDLLLKGKNKQAALYYRLFNLNDDEFLIKQLLPRLLQGQDLYSNYVMHLFKQNTILLDAIVEQIDPVAGIRIVESVNKDVTYYPKLIQHMQYSAFKHNAHEFKDWFKCEEIFSFCPLFVKWYAEECLEEPLKTSVLVRNNLKQRKEGEEFEEVINPLFTNDAFTYTEQIIGKHHDKKYWKLKDLGLQEQDVIFVDDDSSSNFQFMQQTLFSAKIIGFDSEFRATSHKYQSSGVSIIQLSANKKVFIIDFIKLGTSERTIALLRKLFLSSEILKVGHSLKCDFLYLNKTMDLENNDLNSFIDIADLFKIKYPQENQSSLSHIVLAMTGVLLSKYQQRSNWNKRPLRKSQLHYAGLDAYICEIIYDKLNQDVELTSQKLQKKEKIVTLIVQEGWLSYGAQYSHFIAKPKFLIDNMLKRLSTYLRNLGLDAEYLTVRDFNLAISIASNQNRIIVTKDKHLKFKKNIRVPVYLIQSEQSQNMTKQVVATFKIKLQQYELLSRCVKCNNSELILVDREQALSKLNFKHKDSAIKQFWSCSKCQQFYWEGHSYSNSRKRFASFI